MQIDLSKHELELIDAALDSWEKDPGNAALFTGMLGAMMIPKDKQKEHEIQFEEKMRKTEETTKQRKRQVIMLKAKLYQALSRDSEHTIET